MTDAAEFGRVVLIVAVGFAVAILSSRISGRLRVPAPALFLAAATVSSDLIPNLAPLLTIHDVERICLVALIVILFDGGMDIGVDTVPRVAVADREPWGGRHVPGGGPAGGARPRAVRSPAGRRRS